MFMDMSMALLLGTKEHIKHKDESRGLFQMFVEEMGLIFYNNGRFTMHLKCHFPSYANSILKWPPPFQNLESAIILTI